MIEFKAECGHTIRARDEDEGKVVRCSYCGRETQVPISEPDDLDSLFSEVESSEGTAAGAPSRKQKRAMQQTGPAVRTERPALSFNPFAVAMKMAYGAAIIIVLIVVGHYVWSSWNEIDWRGEEDSDKGTIRGYIPWRKVTLPRVIINVEHILRIWPWEIKEKSSSKKKTR